MKITIGTVLLVMIILGLSQAQIERNGWKIIFVTYYDDKALVPVEKTDKKYGEPTIVFFVKDYPYKVGQEYPKLLTKNLTEDNGRDQIDVKLGPAPGLTMSLEEYDCSRGLSRTIKWFWSDGTETEAKPYERMKWDDIYAGTPAEAMMNYACRPRTASKP